MDPLFRFEASREGTITRGVGAFARRLVRKNGDG
jgi:hypothetical protein